MREILLLALGGAMGTVSRYLVNYSVNRFLEVSFPYATLAVNCAGSLVIGFLMQLFIATEFMSSPVRTALTVGFLGAFTTFSTFCYETVLCFERGNWLMGIANVTANLLLSIIAVLLGMAAARSVAG